MVILFCSANFRWQILCCEFCTAATNNAFSGASHMNTFLCTLQQVRFASIRTKGGSDYAYVHTKQPSHGLLQFSTMSNMIESIAVTQ